MRDTNVTAPVVHSCCFSPLGVQFILWLCVFVMQVIMSLMFIFFILLYAVGVRVQAALAWCMYYSVRQAEVSFNFLYTSKAYPLW